MQGKNHNITTIIKVAGALVSFYIGAGIATGQEVLQYFVPYGYWGIGTGILAIIIFAFYCSSMVGAGKQLQAKTSLAAYQYYCGRHLGYFFEWFSILIVFLVLMLMISGAGATCEEFFGTNPVISRIAVSIAVLTTVLLGLKKMISLLGFIGPIIVVILVLNSLTSFFMKLDGFIQFGETIKTVSVSKPIAFWWLSGILYPTSLIMASIPFLTGIGSTLEKKNNAVLGGLAGGIAVKLTMLIVFFGLAANIEQIFDKAVPNMFLAKQIHPAFGIFYTISIILGLYTTAVPMLWTVANKFGTDNARLFNITAVIVSILAFFGGLIPYGMLIGFIYPYLGFIGLIPFAGIVYRTFINKGKIESIIAVTKNYA